MSNFERVVADYKATLSQLQRNDKLRINVLTILAEDYTEHSDQIVQVIEGSILEAETIPLKLVRLYLIDSIVKNTDKSSNYIDNFSVNLVKIFLHVFQRADEKVRESLFKLRNTWSDVFPRGKLYMLDFEVNSVDKKWPVVAPVPKRDNSAPQQVVNKPSQAPQVVPKVKTETSWRIPSKTSNANSSSTETVTNPRAKNGSANNQKGRIYINPNFVKEPPTKKPRSDAFPEQKIKKEISSQPAKLPSPLPSQVQSQVPVRPMVIPPIRTNVPPPVVIPPIRTDLPPPNIIVPQVRAEMPPQRFPPPVVRPEVSLPPPARLPPPQIRNEAPRLPNLPSNNRIFVDGKAYEVFYLDNVAVIERNGVPHRISFSGSPRDLIIDGVTHRLGFGETKPIVIDGQTHYVRFGGPSRELYMGDFPFRGAFNGPPIVATINGRRHEIRLMGNPPEVKIEQDPCYELIRQMQNLRQNNINPEVSLPKKEDNKDMKIGDLLAKLQKTGVLDTLSTAVHASNKGPQSSPFNAPSSNRESTPPIIPSNVKMDKFEVRDKPTSPLSEFAIANLKVRYLSIIKSIHQARVSCSDCGILFDDIDSTNYRNHLDEHIQIDINSSSKIHQMGSSRQRYLSEEEWVSYSKIDEVNRTDTTTADLNDDGESSNEEDSDEEMLA